MMIVLSQKCVTFSLNCCLMRKKVVRTILCCLKNSPKKYKILDSKLENKMMEIKASTGSSSTATFRSMNSMILRFPRFRQEFHTLRTIFNQFDNDADGVIGREEVEKGLKTLNLNMNKREVEELFHSCDLDKSQNIQFNEFIVLLCLAYILTLDNKLTGENTSSARSDVLEAIFGTVVEAFLFLDKNGDGKLHKKDIMKALNDAFPWEKSPKHVSRNRLREMKLHRRGEVGFRKFLFVFIDWVGVDGSDDK